MSLSGLGLLSYSTMYTCIPMFCLPTRSENSSLSFLLGLAEENMNIPLSSRSINIIKSMYIYIVNSQLHYTYVGSELNDSIDFSLEIR